MCLVVQPACMHAQLTYTGCTTSILAQECYRENRPPRHTSCHFCIDASAISRSFILFALENCSQSPRPLAPMLICLPGNDRKNRERRVNTHSVKRTKKVVPIKMCEPKPAATPAHLAPRIGSHMRCLYHPPFSVAAAKSNRHSRYAFLDPSIMRTHDGVAKDDIGPPESSSG